MSRNVSLRKHNVSLGRHKLRANNYRNYLNEHQGVHLIFNLSEGALIRGERSFKTGRSLKKMQNRY